MSKLDPLKLINALRESDENIKYIYTQGSCYKFYVFLKTIFPDAICCINSREDHIVTLIDGNFYDINGLVDEGDLRKISKYELKKVEKWSFADNNLLKLSECPECSVNLCYDHNSQKLISF